MKLNMGAAVVAAGLCLAPPALGVGWSPLFEAGAHRHVSDFELTGAPARSATFAWTGAPGVGVRWITGSGRLSKAISLDDKRLARAQRVEVASAADGSSFVVWAAGEPASGRRLLARRVAADGRRGPRRLVAKTLGNREEVEFDIAVDSDGTATIGWVNAQTQEADGPKPGTYTVSAEVFARTLTAAGARGRVVRVSEPGGMAGSPQLTPLGPDMFVVWVANGVRATLLKRDGTPSATWAISSPSSGYQAGPATLAGNTFGRAVVAWVERQIGAEGLERMVARPLRAGKAPGPETELARHSFTQWQAPTLGEPRAAIDRLGAARVVWSRYDYATRRWSTELRQIAPTGELTPIRTLAKSEWYGQSLALVASAESGAGAVVVARTAETHDYRGPVYTSIDAFRIRRDGTMESPRRIANGRAAKGMRDVGLAVDGTGNVIVAWSSTPTDWLNDSVALEARRLVATCPPPIRIREARQPRAVVHGWQQPELRLQPRTSSPAEFRVLRARLSWTSRDGARHARPLSTEAVQIRDNGAIVATLPRSVRPEQRVRLRLQLRARAAVSGCGFGKVTTIFAAATVRRGGAEDGP